MLVISVSAGGVNTCQWIYASMLHTHRNHRPFWRHEPDLESCPHTPLSPEGGIQVTCSDISATQTHTCITVKKYFPLTLFIYCVYLSHLKVSDHETNVNIKQRKQKAVFKMISFISSTHLNCRMKLRNYVSRDPRCAIKGKELSKPSVWIFS